MDRDVGKAELEGITRALGETFSRLSQYFAVPDGVQAGIDWSVVVPTVVGGGATILAALLAFWLAHRAESNRRRQEQLSLSAKNALSGHFKLLQWINLLANINSHIDKHYEQAREFDVMPIEPCLIVGPSVGLFIEPKLLEPEDYKFLLSKQNSDLIPDIMLVESRSSNAHYLFRTYTEMHLALQDWLDGLPQFERVLDGPIAKDKIPKDCLPKFDVKVAQLNRVLAGLVEHLDDDLTLAKQANEKFCNAAHKEYGSKFPKMEFN